ncbi:hypothetical protein FQZ97_536290 [compost metagenome]
MVVTEPLALLVQGNDEELLALQAHQHVQAIAAAGQGVAQVGAEFVQHRGLFEELLQGRRQAVEHVLGQVVGNVALGAAQAGEEGRAVGMPRQGQAGQMQGGDPALGAGVQLPDLVARQRQLADLAEVGRGFVQGQAQVLGLEQHGLGLAEQQARGVAGAADQVHPRRQVLDQVARALVQGHMADAVEVVEHQVEFAVDALEVADEGIDHRFDGPVHIALQQAHGIAAEPRQRRVHRRHQVLQQALGLAVGLVAGQPGDMRALGLQPLAEQAEHGALAEAGRGAEDQHAALASREQALDQGAARQQRPAPGIGREQLGAQQGNLLRTGQAEIGHGSSSPSSRARRIAWVRLRTLSFS